MNERRITPRRGAAVRRLALDHYGVFHAGEYRGARDTWLLLAIIATEAGDMRLRRDRLRHAINSHRAMMRCVIQANGEAK